MSGQAREGNMTYRMSKNQFYEETTGCCPVTNSSRFQLAHINQRLHDIARELLDQRESMQFDPLFSQKPQAIYELGSISACDVIKQIPCLDGYQALHQSLKMMNSDFRFQTLPSAGMVRPAPSLLLIVESFRNYGSNMSEKNRHMYPVCEANDNKTIKCSMSPMKFHFA